MMCQNIIIWNVKKNLLDPVVLVYWIEGHSDLIELPRWKFTTQSVIYYFNVSLCEFCCFFKPVSLPFWNVIDFNFSLCLSSFIPLKMILLPLALQVNCKGELFIFQYCSALSPNILYIAPVNSAKVLSLLVMSDFRIATRFLPLSCKSLKI